MQRIHYLPRMGNKAPTNIGTVVFPFVENIIEGIVHNISGCSEKYAATIFRPVRDDICIFYIPGAVLRIAMPDNTDKLGGILGFFKQRPRALCNEEI